MAKLRILNPKSYRCPNTDPLHIDRPTEDGRFEIQQTCANHILIKVLNTIAHGYRSFHAVELRWKSSDTVTKTFVKDTSPSWCQYFLPLYLLYL